MALPATFSNNTTPTGGQLDNCLNALGALTTVQCTAAGTDALVLTPDANAPVVTAYGLPYPVRFGFTAAATSTGAVSAQVGSLSVLNVYLPSGVQAGNADIQIGFYYEMVYLATLNIGSGGFIIVSSLPSSATVPVSVGNVHNLKIINNSGTPSTKIDITAGRTCLVTTVGLPIFLTSVSFTIDLTATGANGMDTGSRPTSGWVYLYIISTGSGSAGLASATSPTTGSPTFPSGYIYSAYVGAMYCDGSQNLMRSRQLGRRAQYTVVAATNTAVPPNIVNGGAGTYDGVSPVLSGRTVVGNGFFVPLTAGSIDITAYNAYKSSTVAAVLAAPSIGWGYTNSGPTGTAGVVWPILMQATSSDNSFFASFELEGTDIGYASSAAGGALSCMGWTDYCSAG